LTKLNLNQLTDLYSLLSVEGIGPGKIRNLLSKFRSTNKILSSEYQSLLDVDGVSTQLAKRIIRINRDRDKIEKMVQNELSKLDEIDGRIITVWDKEFPKILKKIYDPPLLLYIVGELIERDEYSIAIVGTRQPTSYGKLQTERLSADFAKQGITTVSGMARGIDSIVHNATLKSGGRTIAVIGSGLDVIYPPENEKLFKMISKSGTIISEFPLGTNPDAPNFPKRNRIISGLSLGTIVIETGISGGALQTAAFALDQNREVFALPGNIGVKQSEGTNLLIQKGEAELIRNVDDVLVELELKLNPVLGKNVPIQPMDLNLFEENILKNLKTDPLHIDTIAATTKLSTSDCLVHLLSLEFKGLIKQLPGKTFALL
jgi:DNA processing protein